MSAGPYFYLDSKLKGINPSQFKEAKTAVDSDSYNDGDVIEAWDHVFRWNKNCIPLSTWAEWRNLSDNLADAALSVITGPEGQGGGTDLLSRLETAATRANPDPAVHKFWLHLHSGPEQVLWPNRDQILRGQAVFYRYAPHILASLLQFSLSSGFSSPRISRILNIASYLVPPMDSTPEGEPPRISKESNDRTFQRLLETTQWLVDCMGTSAMDPGGTGWSATVRVRLLHAMMRRRILEKSRQEWAVKGFSVYNAEIDGIPISQEDMVATFTAFCTAPLLCLTKAGISPLPMECEDFMALWRVIGYYFGIDESILQTHFSDWQSGKYAGASAIVTMFAGEIDPPPPCYFPFDMGLIPEQYRIQQSNSGKATVDPYVTPATLSILFSMCNRWPIPFTFSQQCCAARHLVGPSLSDWLSIPRSSLSDEISYQIGFSLANFPPRFARIYRRGWDEKRRNAMRRSVEFAVRYELGNRLSKFRPREPDALIPAKEADEFGGVDQGESLGVALHEWIVLYSEMVLVLALPVVPVGLFISSVLRGKSWF